MACAPSREPELRIDECQLDVKIGRKPAPEVEAVSTRSQSHNLTVMCPDVLCALAPWCARLGLGGGTVALEQGGRSRRWCRCQMAATAVP